MKKINSILSLLLMITTSVSYAQIKHTKFSTVINLDTTTSNAQFYNSTIDQRPDNGGYIIGKYYDDGTYGCRPSMMMLDYKGNIILDTVYEMSPFDGMAGTEYRNNVVTSSGNAMLYNSYAAVPNYLGAPYLIKTDFNGNVLWQNAYSDSLLDMNFNQVISTLDGGYMLVGKNIWGDSLLFYGEEYL